MVHRPEAQWMLLVRSAGFLIVLLTAGCAWMDRAPQHEAPATGAAQEEKAPALAPQKPVAIEENAAAPRRERAARKPAVPVAAEPAPPAASPPPASAPPPATVSTNQSAAKPEAPAAKPPAKPLASPPPKKEGAAPPAPKPAAPTLDLTALEMRLKETSAIGVFTKLTLKNQVDDLLNRFRAYYQGRAKTTLAELRQPYDLLILKVLTLLQDGDPTLASAIRASREAIWAILSDPVKFSKLAS